MIEPNLHIHIIKKRTGATFAIRYFLFFFSLIALAQIAFAQIPPQKLRYGVACYDEYMPYNRLDKEVQMMNKAGINVVPIAESTWGKDEQRNGVFDFSHIDRMLNAMHKAAIYVIIGTLPVKGIK